jgi:hypothetical protein
MCTAFHAFPAFSAFHALEPEDVLGEGGCRKVFPAGEGVVGRRIAQVSEET